MMRHLPPLLLVLVAGCANDFDFNVVVGPVEGDVMVYADGVAQPVNDLENNRVMITRHFDSFDEGLSSGMIELSVFEGDRELSSGVHVPGACPDDVDWEIETQFLFIRQTSSGLEVVGSRVECEAGDRRGTLIARTSR